MASETYDFIIVGGGTAGLVLANRLSEDTSRRVLVLEAGTDHSEDLRVKTPALYAALGGTEIDWGFLTEPQEALNGRAIKLHQGKALGGTSIINAQIFSAPTRELIDAWASLGNNGWDWKALETYYNKVYTPPSVPKNLEKELGIDHRTAKNDTAKGPIQLSFPGEPLHPIRRAWAETFKSKGYLMEVDPWLNVSSVGAFSTVTSVDPIEKQRYHVARAYYDPIKDRKNLHVRTGAPVDKIIFEGTKAVGVQYQYEAETKVATAGKEIILSAGALQSPKLLELSGVGSKSLLTKHGIEAVKDLEGVGENLMDHPVCDIGFEAVDDVDTLDALARQEPKAIEEAMNDGLLTSSAMKTCAYMPVVEHLSKEGREALKSLLERNRPSPGAQARTQAYYEVSEKSLLDPTKLSGTYLTGIGQSVALPDPSTGEFVKPFPGKHISLAATPANPLSRGSVHIRSKDVSEPPAIDPKYLTNPVDLEIYAHHMLYLHKIARSPPFTDLLKQPLKVTTPLAKFTDLEGAKKYLKGRAISMWHPAGTCAMLPEDKGGVVDTKLKVYGVQNLRVVDASIVPLLPPGHLQSTVYAVAERAADIIKEEYGLK
ncbi:putative GMC oxidoreductase [Hypoxylon trugodes]|uniref:putative GMC oxidoreductase n=1 Tax=Hypoxylon trugodes TaxID=326681 RepID=UPI00219EF636|nr:putative GMC oxidoreductase [Hypoxylon trugodes]KAI1391511.1 putative GMC oxidoreductase [Hypoxylon trugodes]